MKNNKLFLLIPAFLLIIPLAYFTNRFELSYSISSKGILYPAQEWVLSRTADGNLINSTKNNLYNSITQFSVTEFQRGDVANFTVLPEIFRKQLIEKGDTIALINSQYEHGRYIELMGELSLQKKLLSVYASGEKPDLINIANERINLAKQELETQQRITERTRILFEKSYVPEEEYELSLNELNIKKQNYLIAESEYIALNSGAKQEQLDYVRANISAIEQQLKHLEDIMQGFVITSPITGKLSKQQGPWIPQEFDIIINVAESGNSIIKIPIDVYNSPYVFLGQNITFTTPLDSKSHTGYIIDIDNASQMLVGKQKIFATAQVSTTMDIHNFYPNMQVIVTLSTENISLMEYVTRLINEVYNN